MQKMIADKAFTYRGVQLCVGQEFDTDDEHVELFTQINFAHSPRGQQYETRVMTAGHNMLGRRRAMRKTAAST